MIRTSDFFSWRNLQPSEDKNKSPCYKYKGFFAGKNGPLLPHYEEENLKSPYLDNRLFDVAKV